MRLLIGLGNPGPKYVNTRHNVGFMLVDALAEAARADFREKFKGHYARGRVGGEDCVLLKPATYMNLSGESLQAAMRFFKLELDDVLVIHDELDLAFGDVRLKSGGGLAGHNGLKSIVQHCGGPGFDRLRIGIGRPPKGSTESWVLSDFRGEECAALPSVLDEAARAVKRVIEEGIGPAMNVVNRREN